MVLSGVMCFPAAAQELTEPPRAPGEEDFAALRRASPFLRTLRVSDTYALRGVAMVDGHAVATLYNRETEKSIQVTPEGENESGLQLVEVVPAHDLEGVAAKVSFAGEVSELRYDEEQISPESARADGKDQSRREDGERDGRRRRGPSREDIERFRSLSDEQKSKLRTYIGQVMRNHRDLSREERGNLIRGAMIRLSDGRDITVEENSGEDSGRGRSDSGGENRGR